MVALFWSGAPLPTDEARWGILSFEFAGNLARADTMLASWERKGAVEHAAFNLGLDYAFLLACVVVADSLKTRSAVYARSGEFLARTPFGAALLDAVENAALIQVVLGTQAEAWPALAWWCTLVKFVLVGLGILYVLFGLGYWLIHR